METSSKRCDSKACEINCFFISHLLLFHQNSCSSCFNSFFNPAMKTSYSIVTLKGKQAIAPMERLITLFHQFS